MTYAYLRKSTKGQNIARQRVAMEHSGFAFDGVFEDAQSGRTFDRKEYSRLLSTLRRGDLLVVKHPDRIGRDYDEIKEQWRHIVKDIGADIYILDYPMLDTRKYHDDVLQTFIGDIVLQVLCFKADMEYTDSKQRQMEGIAAMPVVDGKRVSSKTGNALGRPSKGANDFQKFLEKQKNGQLTVDECCEALGIGRTTWYRLVKEAA
jgi:DNA invertase Pin-like site-specific DNA recombinase